MCTHCFEPHVTPQIRACACGRRALSGPSLLWRQAAATAVAAAEALLMRDERAEAWASAEREASEARMAEAEVSATMASVTMRNGLTNVNDVAGKSTEEVCALSAVDLAKLVLVVS